MALLDQPYAKDDKQSVGQILGDASIVAFAQVRDRIGDTSGVPFELSAHAPVEYGQRGRFEP